MRSSRFSHFDFQGGMKAVIWTDVFQSVIIFAGMIAIVTLVSAGPITSNNIGF